MPFDEKLYFIKTVRLIDAPNALATRESHKGIIKYTDWWEEWWEEWWEGPKICTHACVIDIMSTHFKTRHS
jgi:hypothetical protein